MEWFALVTGRKDEPRGGGVNTKGGSHAAIRGHGASAKMDERGWMSGAHAEKGGKCDKGVKTGTWG